MAFKVAILGDGAMGTICAQILAGKGTVRGQPLEVVMWGRSQERLRELHAARRNTRYLPGIDIPAAVQFESDEARAVAGAALLVSAVPTQYIRATLGRFRAHLAGAVPVVSVAKGIEIATFKRPSQIVRDALGERPVAALSGPSIASELARKLPATMVAASPPPSPAASTPASTLASTPPPSEADDLSVAIQELFTTPYLRVYRNHDLLGVELAGALKNVIAVAAGILDGMRAGNNAKAALLTRGLVEISRLGLALGAQAETFSGLAGLGDLVTTCVSPEGRNRTFGQRVGQGEKPADVLASMPGVVEGVPTCKSVVALARSMKVGMPISEGLHAVLFEGRDVKSQLADLMTRELKHELESENS